MHLRFAAAAVAILAASPIFAAEKRPICHRKRLLPFSPTGFPGWLMHLTARPLRSP